MRRPRQTLSIVALLAALGCAEEPPPPAIECTELACNSGFDLWLTSTDNVTTFFAGRYDIMIEFGDRGVDGEVDIECNIDGPQQGSCDPPDWETPSAEGIEISVAFGVPPAQAALDVPAIQLHFEGRSEAPAGENVFGPEMLEVEIDRDTRKVGENSYTPTYERDDTPRGDPDCGFCDSRVLEILRLNP